MVRDTLIIAELKAIPDLKKAAFNFDGYGFDKRHPLFMLVFRGQISHGLIGAMISTVGFIGIASAIQDVTYDRYLKIREIIVTMPEGLLGEFSWTAILFPISNAAGLIRAYKGLTNFPWGIILIRWVVLLAMLVLGILLVAFKAKWREP